MARLLFVGAPFGPFFRVVAKEAASRGAEIWRIVVDGGEYAGTPARCRIVYNPRDGDWRGFIERQLLEHRIDTLITFNDTLTRHRVALDVAMQADIHTFVLENGYLRPYWVTLERDGVNGFSRLPKESSIYLDPVYRDAVLPAVQSFPCGLRPHVINTLKHFLASVVLAPLLSFDPRYYGDSIWRQAWGYSREAVWRVTHDEADKIARLRAMADRSGRIFLCLMQKPGDAQLVVHSRHGGNSEFLKETLTSFSRFAPLDATLVIKQHPLDYGIENSPDLVSSLVSEMQLSERVFYLRKTSIDVVTPLVSGVVTINSTAGLAMVLEGKPVICVGRAFYAIPGLTFSGKLSEFWTESEPPSPTLVHGFLAFLHATSQIHGGFHTREGREILAPQMVKRLMGVVNIPESNACESSAAVGSNYAARHKYMDRSAASART